MFFNENFKITKLAAMNRISQCWDLSVKTEYPENWVRILAWRLFQKVEQKCYRWKWRLGCH